MRYKAHETWYRGFKVHCGKEKKKNQIGNEVYPNKGDCARKMITANLKQKDMHLIIFVP